MTATPVPGVHVYAPGNPKYIAVSVTVLPVTGLTIGAPIFPAGNDYFFAPLQESVKVYSKPFVILRAGDGHRRLHQGPCCRRGRDGDGERHGGLPGVRRQGVLPAAVAAVFGGCAGEAPSLTKRSHHARKELGAVALVPSPDDDQVVFRVDPDRVAAKADRGKRRRWC